jgi:UDP-N-acetylmuramoyl-L-alanyl-D-glutamate--2,6-diaminopimelate ligase
MRVEGEAGDVQITAITYDSRSVAPGALFCCLRGARTDGHDHAPAAVAAGAAALLVDHPVPGVAVPQVVVADTRAAMARVAAAFFGHPSRQLAVVGVTGTNGKTTVTHLLQAALSAAGTPTAVIGTLTQARTTPEAPDLQARLAALVAAGTGAVAMEVSSHALAQGRADGTWFSVAVFTNLSQDHLDYHGTMDEYFEAKAALFTPERAALAVINADDPWGRVLGERAAAGGLAVRTYSLAEAEPLDGSTFRWAGQVVRLRLPGRHNVANALAAATAARALGAEPAAVAEGLSSLATVPGRFEPVDAGQPFTVAVDYAHTPDALSGVLAAARETAGPDGRVLVVFGCGGERDRAKRPAMGEVAVRQADVAVLTSDNPRSEDPLAIIDEVRAGAEAAAARGAGGRLVVEPDRRTAIARALGLAREGDAVVVAGKGHERTQVAGGRAVPFDDREVAREELERLRGDRERV